ncbi:hypothetical protein FJTKL_12601 [Diaporthe vaccinii]|uniref:C2H2-type domain-containing protein n=2 Tax=Diaporthe vaccinii TaxID=105482 RepID=A0ABR4EDI0_9PEZI
MDSWSRLRDPHGEDVFPFNFSVDDLLPNQNSPTESGLHSRTPQEAKEIADGPTHILESAASVRPYTSLQLNARLFKDEYPSVSYETLEPEQSKSSDWSEPTICLSPGHHDGSSLLRPELQHSDPSSFPTWSASKPPQESPAWRHSPLKSRKRPRGSEGGDDLESDGGWDGKKLRRGAQPKPKLYCLFFIKDPVKHHDCSNCQFGDWARLREHLFRKHRQPVHCPVCGIVFRGDVKEAKNARDEHIHECSGSFFKEQEPSGITEEKEDLIRTLTWRGKRTANQDVWLAGWRILFPNSALPLQPFFIQRRPQDDASNLTDADFRLLASREFRLWIQSFPGLSSVGEDQRTEICKELIQTFNARLLGQDTRSSQVSRREDGTNQDAAFKPLFSTQWVSSDVPQDLEFLGDAFGDSPSTSSAGPSPDADTESPLFASIRRILSADPSYAAEDVISAIKKRSDGKVLALPGSEPAVIDSLISKAPAGQESTSQGTKWRPIGRSGRSESPENKKQKTCTPSDADGDDEGGSGSNGDAGDDGGLGEDGDDKSSDGDGRDRDTDGNGADGNDGGGDGDSGSGDGTPPHHTPDEPSEGWICPYCLKYVEITCVKGFEVCGRPGFRSRDRLRTHLRRFHSPEARFKNLKKSLAQYYMSPQQWKEVKEVMDNIKRPQKKKHPEEWLQVQRTWYQKVWAILFPLSQYVPDSPFHTSNEALKERCHQVVEAMMDLECERAQARDCSSHEDTQLFTRPQVQDMLDKALQIGLDSLPIVAQHFGRREAVEATNTEPQTGAEATTPEDEAAGPAPDRADGVTPNTEAAATETEGSLTPENTLPRIPKAVTPQTGPFQFTLDAQQTSLQQYSDVLLENSRQINFISIQFNPRNTPQATDQASVARVQVTAPSTFSVKIGDPYNLDFDNFGFEGLEEGV